jgi:hypothetical protein
MEYFEVFLYSDDALSGSGSPSQCVFNLGNVYDFAPNAHLFQNANHCFVKVKYFSIEQTASNFNTASIGTIIVEMDGALPNAVRSKEISSANFSNMVQSNIIGIVPTSITKNTYSSNTYDNDFVKANNIFNGNITITLKDESGALTGGTIGASNKWCMVLCVAFEKDDNIKAIPHTASTNYFSY